MSPQNPTSAQPANDRDITLDEFDELVRQKYGIPKGLWKGMSAQESGGDWNAKSSTGVKGKYQVTKATASQYGLDRDDPWDQTVAAARHLRKQFDALSSIKNENERWLGAVGRYYAGDDAVKADGSLSSDSIDGVSNPAEHVDRVARNWAALERDNQLASTSQRPEPPIEAWKSNTPKPPARPFRRSYAGMRDATTTEDGQLPPSSKPLGPRREVQPKQSSSPFEFRRSASADWATTGTPALKTTLIPDRNAPNEPVDFRRALVEPVLAAQQQQAVNPIETRLPRPEPPPTSFRGAMSQIGNAAAKGFAGIPEGVAELADLAEQYTPIGRLGKAIQEGISGQPAPKIAPQLRPYTQAAERAIDEAVPIDPNDEGWLTAKIPRAAGSVIPLVTGGLASGGSRAAMAVLGAAANAKDIGTEFDQAGGDPAKRDQALAMAAATGLTEVFGVGKLLAKFGANRKLLQTAKSVLEEGGQEAFQQWLNNINAAEVGAYDPNRPQTEGVFDAGVLGATIGGGLGVASGVANRLKSKPGAQAQTEVTNQQRPSSDPQPPSGAPDARLLLPQNLQPSTADSSTTNEAKKSATVSNRNIQQSEEQAGPLKPPSRMEVQRLAREQQREATATDAENTALDASERRAQAEQAGDLKTVVAEWTAEITALRERHKAAKTPQERALVARGLQNALTGRAEANERLKLQMRERAKLENAPTADLPGQRLARPLPPPQRSERLLSAIENEGGGVPDVPEVSVNFARLAEQQEKGEGDAIDRKRLLSRIRELGGINPAGHAGEIVNAVEKKYPGLINRRSGMKPDDLLADLAQDYAVDRHDLNTLWQAMDDDASGKPVYPLSRSRTAEIAAAEEEYYRQRYEQDDSAALEPLEEPSAPMETRPESQLELEERPQSPYARLVAANKTDVDRLHELQPGSPEAVQIWNGLRQYATDNDIQQKHLGALADSISNYQGDRARSRDLRERWSQRQAPSVEEKAAPETQPIPPVELAAPPSIEQPTVPATRKMLRQNLIPEVMRTDLRQMTPAQLTDHMDYLRREKAQQEVMGQDLVDPGLWRTTRDRLQLANELRDEAKAQKQEVPSGFLRATEKNSSPLSTSPAQAEQPQSPPSVQKVRHDDPKLAGQPILAETKDGRLIVPNPDNALGISVVKGKQGKFSSTQVNLPAPVAEAVTAFGKKIPDSDLAADGREREPHITVKYGLHGENPDEVAALLADQPPIRVRLGKTSLFENEDADVLKVDVDSPDLHKLNAKLVKALPNTETHPDYKPHLTIAYLKPGAGKKYAGNDFLDGKEVTLDRLLFSSKTGKQTELPLQGQSASPQSVIRNPQSSADASVETALAQAKLDPLDDGKVLTTSLGLATTDFNPPGQSGAPVLTKVPIEKLVLSRDNLDVERLRSVAQLTREEMAAIKDFPLSVTEDPSNPGHYIVRGDGNHRVAVLQLRGERGDIPAKVTRVKRAAPIAKPREAGGTVRTVSRVFTREDFMTPTGSQPEADPKVRADADTILRVLDGNNGVMSRPKLGPEAMLVNSRSKPALELLKSEGKIVEDGGQIRLARTQDNIPTNMPARKPDVRSSGVNLIEAYRDLTALAAEMNKLSSSDAAKLRAKGYSEERLKGIEMRYAGLGGQVEAVGRRLARVGESNQKPPVPAHFDLPAYIGAIQDEFTKRQLPRTAWNDYLKIAQKVIDAHQQNDGVALVQAQDELLRFIGKHGKLSLKRELGNVLALSRGLVLSGDFSFLRQSQNLAHHLVRNPKQFLKQPVHGLGVFLSEQAGLEARARLRNTKNWQQAQRDGVHSITEAKDAVNFKPTEVDESSLGKIADKIPLLRQIERANAVMTDEARIMTYNDLIDLHAAKLNGIKDVKQQQESRDKYGKQVAKFTNAITGRGNLPKSAAVDVAGGLLTSVRYLASFPDSVYQGAKLAALEPKAAPRVAAYLSSRMVATALSHPVIMSTLGLGLGALNYDDPRDAGFWKAQISENESIDLSGGSLPYWRMTTRVAKIAADRHLPTRAKTRQVFDVLKDFILNRLAPLPRAAGSALMTVIKEESKEERGLAEQGLAILAESLVPVFVQQGVQTGVQYGAREGVKAAGLSILGAGQNKYERLSAPIPVLKEDSPISRELRRLDVKQVAIPDPINSRYNPATYRDLRRVGAFQDRPVLDTLGATAVGKRLGLSGQGIKPVEPKSSYDERLQMADRMWRDLGATLLADARYQSLTDEQKAKAWGKLRTHIEKASKEERPHPIRPAQILREVDDNTGKDKKKARQEQRLRPALRGLE